MFDMIDRPTLKARAKEAIRKASPNIYLVSIVVLLLTNAPTFVTEGSTIRLMLQADSVEEMLRLYEGSALAAQIIFETICRR